MQVGLLTAFLQYLLQILAAVMMGAFMAIMLPRAMVCATRIVELLAHKPSMHEPATTAPHLSTPAALTFDNVGFTYPGADAPVLDEAVSLPPRAPSPRLWVPPVPARPRWST